MLCGSVDERRAGEYMAEVRTSSQSERPCAGIEETRTAPGDAGGSKDPGQRKVHSLIDKVYAPANLAEAWRHVRDNKGGAGIDGLSIAAFANREEERLAALHRKLRDRSYRPTPVKRVGIPKPDGGVRKLGIPSVTDRVVQQALVQKMAPIFEPHFADCSFGYRPLDEFLSGGGRRGWVLAGDQMASDDGEALPVGSLLIAPRANPSSTRNGKRLPARITKVRDTR